MTMETELTTKRKSMTVIQIPTSMTTTTMESQIMLTWISTTMELTTTMTCMRTAAALCVTMIMMVSMTSMMHFHWMHLSRLIQMEMASGTMQTRFQMILLKH